LIDLSPEQVRYLRLRSQRLIGEPPTNLVPLVHNLFAIQAQDASAALLAIRPRSTGITAADVVYMQLKDHILVRTSLLRGTLHLLAGDDLAWLLPAIGERSIQQDRARRKQLGIDDTMCERANKELARHLSEEGSIQRSRIAEIFGALGIPNEGQAVPHLLYQAAYKGIVCRGEDHGKDSFYAPLRDWVIPDLAPPQDWQARLARRYLAAFAPGAPEDLAMWAGILLGKARSAFRDIADELIEAQVDGVNIWMLKERIAWLDKPVEFPTVKLLPAFDNTLLGYRSRDWILPREHSKRIFAGGGLFYPMILINGIAAGKWSTKKTKQGITITVTLFEKLPPDMLPDLKAEVQDVGRFLAKEAELEIIE
jgi:hypothetical protein